MYIYIHHHGITEKMPNICKWKLNWPNIPGDRSNHCFLFIILIIDIFPMFPCRILRLNLYTCVCVCLCASDRSVYLTKLWVQMQHTSANNHNFINFSHLLPLYLQGFSTISFSIYLKTSSGVSPMCSVIHVEELSF